jgi:hypothetical protein
MRDKNICETYHSKILLTNLPFISFPSVKVLWNAHGAGRLSYASAMTYASISPVGPVAISMYVPEDESMCICGERDYLYYFSGIIMIESGVGEDRDRSLSFAHSFVRSLEIRIKQNKKNTYRKINTNI